MIMSVRISETGSWDYNGNSSFDISNDLDTKLSDYIINFLKEKNISTLFDFGCSTGYYLKYISDRTVGVNLIGIEPYVSNRYNHFHNILNYDLAHPFNVNRKGSIVCLEVLEHIPAQFESIVMDNIVNHCDEYCFISWARVGQDGLGHCNEKNFDDVVSLFQSRGFELMEKESKEGRDIAELPWLRSNFGVFRKVS